MNPNDIAIIVFVVYGVFALGSVIGRSIDTWESYRAIRKLHDD